MAAFTGTPVNSTSYAASLGAGALKQSAAQVAGALTIARWTQYVHAAGAGTGEVNLIVLPPGQLVIYPDLSRIICSQMAANADLHLGFRAYYEPDGDLISEDDNAFLDNGDSGGGALDQAFVLPAIGYQVFNVGRNLAGTGGLIIYAMVDTGNIEDTDTLDGWVAYTCIK